MHRGDTYPCITPPWFDTQRVSKPLQNNIVPRLSADEVASAIALINHLLQLMGATDLCLDQCYKYGDRVLPGVRRHIEEEVSQFKCNLPSLQPQRHRMQTRIWGTETSVWYAKDRTPACAVPLRSLDAATGEQPGDLVGSAYGPHFYPLNAMITHVISETDVVEYRWRNFDGQWRISNYHTVEKTADTFGKRAHERLDETRRIGWREI